MTRLTNLPISLTLFLFLIVLTCSPTLVRSQGFRRDRGIDGRRPEVPAGSTIFNRLNESTCNSEYRSFDGTCTNDIFKVAGAAGTAQFSYIPTLSSINPGGAGLKSARDISNMICTQTVDVFNRRGLSEFLVFFGQFLDHTFVASSSTGGSSFNIPVSPSDSIFFNISTRGFLPFTRNRRVEPLPQSRSRQRIPGVERPVNTLSSAIDLAAVYGPSEKRINFLREMRGGLMKTSAGDYLPPNTFGLNNAPSATSRDFFIAGDHRANEHPVLLSFHTLFVREHNKLANELAATFPTWPDEKLFHEARKINIAQFQKIVYEEFFPMMTGRALRRGKGFRKNVLPIVSVEFSTAAFRVGHTMIGNEVAMRGPGMSFRPPIPFTLAFFPTIGVIRAHGIETFLRGAIYTPAQEVDVLVNDMIRNFLFTHVRGEEGLDLIALNLQRGRDHALPSYTSIKRLFTGRTTRTFSDITSDRNLQSRLATAYGHVDKVEAWIGMMAEDHIPGGSMGPTLFAVWTEEFARLRDGDRFFYTRRKLFDKNVLKQFRRLNEILNGRDTMKKILLRNSFITEREIGRSVWLNQFR